MRAPELPATYRLTLAYHGGAFAGWQRQPGKTTVQGCLEEAAGKIWKRPVSIQGSGRTDTGVHALGQVASLEAPGKHAPQVLLRAFNAHLPPAVRVTAVRRAAAGFHARFSASGKIYEYRLWNHPVADPFRLDLAWHVPRPLARAAMRRAARIFVGRHDFAAFTSNPGYARKTTVRTLRRISFRQVDGELRIRFEADGFLYRMVRNLVGGLVQVGLGKISVEELRTILEARQRTAMPPTAPARGLYLVQVLYAKSPRVRCGAEAQEDE